MAQRHAYNRRAIPPSNLDMYDGKYQYNYHVYEVSEVFVVLAGPIAGMVWTVRLRSRGTCTIYDL